jgi:hypothetical protein
MGGTLFKITIFVFLLTFVPLDALAQNKVFNILYTGAIKGELEPCGCSPKSNSGGLARLSGYIFANKEDLKPYLLIDAGNSMGDDTPQGRLKGEVIINSFATIGYDATAFFDDDTLLFDGFLSPLVDKSGVPALSDTPPYPSSIRVKQDSSRINISADPKAYKKGRLNILLSERPVSEAKQNKGWDVIVLSSGEILEEPVEADGTVIVSGYPRGEKLGVLTLTVGCDGLVVGVTHRWQSLGEEMVEDINIRNLIDEYDAKVADLLNDEESRVSSDSTYFGYESCVDCHQPFVERWSATRHANAYASLEAVGKSRDPECVKCHSTGYGEEGGFYSVTATPGLTNVQCEQCHGPGKDHLSDYNVPMASIEESVCLRCHSKENSPDFDFKTYIKKINH